MFKTKKFIKLCSCICHKEMNIITKKNKQREKLFFCLNKTPFDKTEKRKRETKIMVTTNSMMYNIKNAYQTEF
jgi:hypothetical protein